MKAKFTVMVLLAATLMLSAVHYDSTKGDRIMGTYYIYKPETKSESKVQIYKNKEGKYEGKIIWLKKPTNPDGTPKVDKNNPNPKLRSVRLDNLVILKGFKYHEGSDEWIDGEIYDPDDGKTYSCKLKFENDKKLKVRGYVGIPALGKSMYWTKQ
ncbi:MAG: DUF2147 domain-containing protein [Bacteroidales bacterium]|jgi:uncharacterized protein (DUF2147 family)|nr:DUF2147 domain-containing protein [Bacteroidales bacterium]